MKGGWKCALITVGGQSVTMDGMYKMQQLFAGSLDFPQQVSYLCDENHNSFNVIELDVRAQHTTTYMHATTLRPEFYCYKNMSFSKLLSLVPRPFISPMDQGMRLKTTLLSIACSKNKKKKQSHFCITSYSILMHNYCRFTELHQTTQPHILLPS